MATTNERLTALEEAVDVLNNQMKGRTKRIADLEDYVELLKWLSVFQSLQTGG